MRTCARCHGPVSGVRRRFCEDCREERHREQARQWHRENADEVNSKRRASRFDDCYDPDEDPANRPPRPGDIVHLPRTDPPGVKRFRAEKAAREEQPMPITKLRTVRFPPPPGLDEQRHGGRAARGALILARVGRRQLAVKYHSAQL